MFKLGMKHRFISQALKGDYIGLEEIDDGIWNIVSYTTLLGRLDVRTDKITGATFRSEECYRCPRTPVKDPPGCSPAPLATS